MKTRNEITPGPPEDLRTSYPRVAHRSYPGYDLQTLKMTGEHFETPVMESFFSPFFTIFHPSSPVQHIPTWRSSQHPWRSHLAFALILVVVPRRGKKGRSARRTGNIRLIYRNIGIWISKYHQVSLGYEDVIHVCVIFSGSITTELGTAEAMKVAMKSADLNASIPTAMFVIKCQGNKCQAWCLNQCQDMFQLLGRNACFICRLISFARDYVRSQDICMLGLIVRMGCVTVGVS